MPIARGLVHQTQLDEEIATAVQSLGKEVVRVRYSVGADSTGEESIFFRVVLTDAASKEERLAEVTSRVATTLFDKIRPYENWGLLPYFSFRSKSELARRSDPEWS